jgi:recombination protein RecR
MIERLPHLQKLLRELQQVPYLASKNVYRVAHHFLELKSDKMEHFCAILKQAHGALEKCKTCFAWKEKSTPCSFCESSERDATTICVVETWHDLYAIEKTGAYRGVYHVLGGALYPLEGVGPDDLTIKELKARAHSNCKEIILAMNQTPEGDATAALIGRTLQGLPIKITCLARGVPVGSSLEYIDRLTVHKALTERRPF